MNGFNLTGVSYRYDREPVLRDLDLSLEPGEILGLFGHNGAGKTTIIKLLLGLLTPVQGQVTTLGGRPGSAGINRSVGYLPENVTFYPQLTGYEILSHFARLKRAPAAQVSELLSRVGLEAAMHQRVRTYSKGMRQRLGLAQALLGEPRLLMLDEPTVGLDPVATADLYRLLRRLRDQGVGIVLCSHVLPGVEPYIDRAAILASGRLQASGTLAELRQRAHQPVRITLTEGLASKGWQHLLEPTDERVQVYPDGNGRLIIEAPQQQSVAVVRQILARSDPAELQVSQPSLEDLYRFYITGAGTSSQSEPANLEKV